MKDIEIVAVATITGGIPRTFSRGEFAEENPKNGKKLMEINKIFNEDCLETMARMPNEFIDLVVTSPPFDNLRHYDNHIQNINHNGYSFEFEKIAVELSRILKQGGIIVWQVGDAVINGSETLTSFKQAIFFKEKCNLSIHDTMIYKKPSPSFSDSTRYGQVFEYIFIISKGKPKTINLIADKKNKWANKTSFGKSSFRNKDGILIGKGKINVKEFGIRYNIFEYSNGYGYTTKDEIAYRHPALMPEQLAKDMIHTWSMENDIVYDPFAGAGTTCKMAHLLNRKWIGSEINKEYCNIAEKRLNPYLNQRTIFDVNI